MSINYQQISQLNVEGLLAMQQNSHRRALSFFQRCLTILREANDLTRHRDKSSDASGQTPPQKSSFETKSFYQQHQDRTIVSIPLSTSNQHLEKDEEIFTLFNRGMHLQFNDSNTMTAEDFYENTIITAISYNVGLTHQLAGIQQGNSAMLSKALKFYSMAYTSLKNAPEETTQYPASAKLCLLAIANNIACIHAYFRRLNLTKICCEEISKLLTTVLPLEEIPGAPLQAEYQVFLLNVCLFSQSDLSTAPAPAA